MTPQDYNDIKLFIAQALERRRELPPESLQRPSKYWEHFASQFQYVRTLDDQELKHIRRHTYHLTGDNYIPYTLPSRAFPKHLVAEYEQLSGKLGDFGASETEWGIGIDAGGRRICRDLLRYMEVVADLVDAGCLDRSTPQRVLEIGGGFGGLAACVRQYNQQVSYVITDLEETMFFQAVHLANTFGREAVELCSEQLPLALEPGRFYLLPQFASAALASHRFDLAVNQQSMQEMHERQVRYYCDLIRRTATRFYSCNLDQHPDAIVAKTGIATGLRDIFIETFAGVEWRAEPGRRWQRWANRLTGKPPRRRFTDESLPRAVYRCTQQVARRAA